jgi:hypothetical protein
MAQRILLIQDDAVAAAAILDALSDSGDGCFEVERLRSCSPVLNQLDGVAAILVASTSRARGGLRLSTACFGRRRGFRSWC